MFKKAKFILITTLIGLTGFASLGGAQTGSSQTLTPGQQALVPISAFTASGELDRLEISLNEGLDAGLTVNEIKETITQLYAYMGFPRALNAMFTFMEVLEQRKARGINDTEGPAGIPLGIDVDIKEFGTRVQTELVGNPVSGAVYDFAPAIDQFLKEHLFGAVFGRGVLNHMDREIVTIAALANVNGLEPQLAGHFRMGMNAGLTEQQVRTLIAVLSTKVGQAQGTKAQQIFERMVKSED